MMLVDSKIAVKYHIVSNAYKKICNNESMAYLLLYNINEKTDVDIKKAEKKESVPSGTAGTCPRLTILGTENLKKEKKRNASWKNYPVSTGIQPTASASNSWTPSTENCSAWSTNSVLPRRAVPVIIYR